MVAMAGVGVKLTDAFCEFAPLVGDSTVDERRNESARILRPVLERLSYRLRVPDDTRQAALDVTEERLLKSGPRSPLGTSQTARQVEAYLFEMLRNAAIDVWRATRNDPIPESLDDVNEPGTLPDLDQQLDRQFASAKLEEARVKFWNEIVPTIATSTGKQFEETLRDWDRERRGDATFEDLLTVHFGEVSKRSRDSLNQRRSRARKRIKPRLIALRARRMTSNSPGPDDWDDEALVIVITELLRLGGSTE
jgi:DNA-directed RNA polymerase specialized sigma24 family protein